MYPLHFDFDSVPCHCLPSTSDTTQKFDVHNVDNYILTINKFKLI